MLDFNDDEESALSCACCGYAENRIGWQICERCSIPKKQSSTVFAGNAKVKRIRLTNDVVLELIWCPPCSFLMGSHFGERGRDDDEEVHCVTLSRGFWIGKHSVTQEQWQALRSDNPSDFTHSGHPVENVSWNQCQNFIVKMNEKFPGHNFRLPTEAEWECACRAGTETAYPCYNSPQNHLRTENKHSICVKDCEPNAWGICGMIGNVWEWCNDAYASNISNFCAQNPCVTQGAYRVMRGGAYNSTSSFCRSAQRNYDLPHAHRHDTGFRIAAGVSPVIKTPTTSLPESPPLRATLRNTNTPPPPLPNAQPMPHKTPSAPPAAPPTPKVEPGIEDGCLPSFGIIIMICSFIVRMLLN